MRNDTFVRRAPGRHRPALGRRRGLRLRHELLRRSPRRQGDQVPGRRSDLGRLGGGEPTWAGAALWYAIRAEDGRGSGTALTELVPSHFGLRRPRQVLEAVYYGRLAEDRLVELAPLVFRAATAGDDVARSVVDRQADEIVAMVTTAIKRLRMQKLDVDVVLGGGIFRTEDEEFFQRIEAGVREVAPSARFSVLTDPPVIGAAARPRSAFARRLPTLGRGVP